MSEQLLIGWAEESITPDQRVMLAGQFFERISEYVETPVTATAIAVESGGGKMVICSCDLCSVDAGLLASVRETVGEVTGLLPGQIILCATHTHTSLLYESAKKSSLGLDVFEKFLPRKDQKVLPTDCMDGDVAFRFLTERISKAVCMAWENRKPACFANGFGRSAVGMCRRVVYDDKSAKMWGDTNQANFVELEGGNDSGIELLYIYDDVKKLTGVVANLACPSQVVEHRNFISSDYWGKVKILLRERFGEKLFVLGLCAAAGDQCPRDMIRWVSPETPIDDPNIKRQYSVERRADPSMFDVDGSWKIGRRIANEIIAVFDEITEIKKDAILSHEVFTLDLPLRRVTPQEYEKAKHILENYLRDNAKLLDFCDNATMHVHAGTLERYEVQQNTNLHSVEIHVARFGDVVFATNPFELFLDYGNQIRARSKAKQTFLIQLACGSSGYLPTKKAEMGGHYSAYVSSGFVGHEGGDFLVRKTLDEINALWA